MKKIIILTLLLLTGCTDKFIGAKVKKDKIEGLRVPVIEVKENFIKDDNYKAKIVLPSPSELSDWKMPGGMAHASLQHIASKAEFKLDYKKDIGSGNSYRNRLLAEPIVANGFIYTIDVNAVVKKIKLDDGDVVFKKRFESVFSSKGQALKGAGLAYQDGKLFISLGSGEIHVISDEDYKTVWSKTLPSPLRSAPLVYGGRVYALSVDNKVNVLSAYNGELLWDQDFGSSKSMIMGVPTPSADMGIVVFGLSVGEIVALRSDNGAFLWRATHSIPFAFDTIENMHDIKGRIIIDNDKVYVSSNIKTSAYDLKDGALLWEKEVGSINNPVLVGDYLFILSNDNYILTMMEKTGEVIAGIKLPQFEDEEEKLDKIFWSGPRIIQDKIVVAGTNGEIRLYSPYNGELIKKIDQGGSFSLPMIAVKDKVIFINDNADLLVFKWEFQ